MILLVLLVWLWMCPVSLLAQHEADYFKITVVDAETGRGVPLVELTTVNNIRHYTDSSGIVAFYEPGLMGEEVFFFVASHGYEFPKDGFGYAGTKLTVTSGGEALLKINRIHVAERLYRTTGGGIYHHSVLVGHPVVGRHPVLNGKVFGQDTVMVTPYRNKLYWFWGDTNRVAYPLGQFAVSGATSELPGKGGLQPDEGVDFTYFVDHDGFSKKMCPLPGPGVVWIEGLMNVRGEDGQELLIAQYERRKSLEERVELGLVVFNDEKAIFEPLMRFDNQQPLYPRGHPVRVSVDGEEYFYFGHPHPSPFPNVRVKAKLKSIMSPESYETFTCFTPGSRYDAQQARLDRQADGRLCYGWKTNAAPLNTARQAELVNLGKIKAEEGWLYLQDIVSGERLQIHAGSVFWNEYRQRWILVGEQAEGSTSSLGELWYAEADTIVGPWVYAQKIVTHNNYTFYNPTQHPFFDHDHGRIIYFEGTYTATFARGQIEKTARYDYNQIMYRLKLDDPRLFLPCPVYRLKNSDELMLRETVTAKKLWHMVESIAFFAVPPDRPKHGLVPIFAAGDPSWPEKPFALHTQPLQEQKPVFYALAVDQTETSSDISGQWQCLSKEANGTTEQFVLNLQLDHQQVTGSCDYGKIVGTYAQDKLTLQIGDFQLTGELIQGKWAGEWQQTGTNNKGCWEGRRTDTSKSRSTACVPLYEYRDEKSGKRLYTTADLATNTAWLRQPLPLCMVWKNPMSELILDFAACEKSQ